MPPARRQVQMHHLSHLTMAGSNVPALVCGSCEHTDRTKKQCCYDSLSTAVEEMCMVSPNFGEFVR